MHEPLLAFAAGDAEKYGVFAATVAVAAMIVAALGAIGLLWRGPLSGWEVPSEGAFASRLVVLPTAFLLVAGFFYANPQTEWIVLLVGGVLTVITLFSGVAYASLLQRFRRHKEVIAGTGATRKVPVLAGDELTTWARQTMHQRNLTEQQCFKGTPNEPYEPEQMWTPPSRIRVYKKATWLFILTMFCGTGALSWMAYGVEVKVTGKAAAEILSPTQIPDGKPKPS